MSLQGPSVNIKKTRVANISFVQYFGEEQEAYLTGFPLP
jgi:hypothetical protein